MARFSHLPLYAKMYEQIKHAYRLVKQFPKEYKFTLGEDILKLHWQISDSIIDANSTPSALRRAVLNKLSQDFDCLKIRLRMAHEIGLIDASKFSRLQEEMAEIGKMIGGWCKWTEK